MIPAEIRDKERAYFLKMIDDFDNLVDALRATADGYAIIGAYRPDSTYGVCADNLYDLLDKFADKEN